jgi:glycosyltransferase involved in cell wall biosynthesis
MARLKPAAGRRPQMDPSSEHAAGVRLGAERLAISAVVVCFNEEDNIGSCLESASWCDEIIVVDSFRTDKTVEICRRYTERVIQRSWSGFREQVSFAISEASRDWVLLIDADERISSPLRKEIEDALTRPASGTNGFAMPRLVYYFDRWWWRGGWYPDYKLRLFRRGMARCVGLDPHPKIEVQGTVRRLRNPIYHFSYRNVADHINRINSFTTISSQLMRREGKQWSWADALFRPLTRFLRCYVWKRGFLEGFPGFFIAVTAAYYVFLKYAKLRESEIKASHETIEKQTVATSTRPPVVDNRRLRRWY